MKAVVEFSGYFRMKTECGEADFEIPDGSTVHTLLMAVEEKYRDRRLRFCDSGKLKDGILIFFRNEGGGLERIDASARISARKSRIVISNLMGGG